MKPFFNKLKWLAHRRHKEDELQEELRFHLEEEAEGRQAGGLAQDQARRAALRDLGNLTLVQENTRAAWMWVYLEQLVGLPLRPAHHGGEQNLQRAGDSVAGAGHRGQYGNLQLH